jgi:trimethylamine monooxygenase
MQRVTFSFNIVNIQSWYARDVILGKIILPLTKQEMELDIQLWKEKEIKVTNILD